MNWGLDLLQFPPPGCIPTVEEMATPIKLVEQPREKPRGLFQEMLGGNPHELQHLLTPLKSGVESARDLLEELQAGTRSYANLSPDERTLLDEATALALSEPPVRRKIERPFQHVQEKEEEQEWQEKVGAPSDEAGLPAFWWLG